MQTLHCKGKISRFRSPTDQIFESARGATIHKKRLHNTFAESYQGGRGRESILGQSGVYWQEAKGKTNTWNQHKCLCYTFHQGQPFTNIMRIFDPTPHGAVRGIFSLISLFVWTIRSCSTMATAFQRGVNLSNGMYKKSSLVTKHKNIFNHSRSCKKAFKTPFLPPGSLTNTLPVSSVIPLALSPPQFTVMFCCQCISCK